MTAPSPAPASDQTALVLPKTLSPALLAALMAVAAFRPHTPESR